MSFWRDSTITRRNRNVKILYCNKYNFRFSGTESYLFDLMDLVRSHGHEAELFSMADPRGVPTRYDRFFVPHIDFKSEFNKNGLKKTSRLCKAGHAIHSIQSRRCLRGMIAAFCPDVAHVRNIYHHLSPSILWELKAQGIPIIYHINDFKLLCPSYSLVANGKSCEACRGGRFRNVITKNCYAGGRGAATILAVEAYVQRWLRTYQKCVDHFVAPSQFVKQKLVEHGFPGDKVTVVPHFQSVCDEITAPPADGPILYFGRLSREKGLEGLIRAMKRLPHLQLEIAGEGPERARLESLAASLYLDNIHFLGQLSRADVDRAICASRFTVMPSLAYETFGKNIAESFAHARSVVASDLGSRRELIRPGENGLLFEPDNEKQMAETISFLAESPRLAETMGVNGRKLIEEHHSPAQHYHSMIQLYEEMARLKHARTISIWKPTKPRVAFIGARGVVSKYSGIESYYEEVGPRLAEMGYDVEIYCRKYFTPRIAAYKGMHLLRLPTIRTKHLETLVHTFLSTLHAIFTRCDIVHFHALGPSLFSFLPRLAGQKTVVTVQGLDWQRKKWGPFAARVLRLGEWASAHFPSRTMVVSKTLQERYRRRYDAETILVPNGTALRDRTAPSRLAAWELEAGQYILFLGRFSPEKNCHLLIEAYERLDTPVKLVLAGGSSHTDSYVETLRSHAGDKIRFLAWVSGDALNELVTNAALFVLPSDLEGMSLALLDAMGAGVCTLTSDIPENRELTEDAGFTFRPGDVDDLSRLMALLISDPEIRRLTAEKAKERIREHFLWPTIARQINDVYQELLYGKTTRPMPAARPSKKAPTAVG
jgi:glycosyltransferase involved in cell wall biosynthesis